MMRHYLRRRATHFIECGDGSEVLPAYAEFWPDWVLMDWEMKFVGGLTATRELVRKFPEAKVLIVTNYDEETLRRAAFEAGALGYVLKDDLIEILRFMDERPGA